MGRLTIDDRNSTKINIDSDEPVENLPAAGYSGEANRNRLRLDSTNHLFD